MTNADLSTLTILTKIVEKCEVNLFYPEGMINVCDNPSKNMEPQSLGNLYIYFRDQIMKSHLLYQYHGENSNLNQMIISIDENLNQNRFMVVIH